MNSCKTRTKQNTHVIHTTSFTNFLQKIRNARNKILLCSKLSASITHAFISFLRHDPSHRFYPFLLHSLICSFPDWLSICVFTVSTNHRLLKTKANPGPDIKSALESPRCAALIHFSYPRGTSKSPSINREAALS